MFIRAYPIIRGLGSYILPMSLFKRPGTGGTVSSEYCYSVWLRHLYYLHKNKLIKEVSDIKDIAEIGPGDTLGIGLSALYTGATNYYAFDVIKHANVETNLRILKELKTYFGKLMEIPHGDKFPNTNPPLDDYSFPGHILSFSQEYYNERYTKIKASLRGDGNTNVDVQYVVPWTKGSNNNINNIDLIYSQAVMEHIVDIDFAYSEMYKWLKPGGIISHQVDFKAHEVTKAWNGHWFISRHVWNFLAHGRKYPISRLPLSAHIKSIEKAGFKVKFVLPVHKPNAFKNQHPKVDGVTFSADDLITASALIQAVKY